MNRQRGITNGWIILIAVIVLIGLAITFTNIITNYLEDVDARAFTRGQQDMETKYAKRDNAALIQANADKDAAVARAQKLEGEAGKRQAEASARYQQGVRDGRNETERRIAAVNDGTGKLRDPGRTSSTACNQQAGDTKTATGATGSDAEKGAELSAAFAGFLLILTGEADDVARQLAEAQAIIESDRVLCNAP